MNRRKFLTKMLPSGLVAAVAPTLFLPKLIEAPKWKRISGFGVDCRELDPAWIAAELELWFPPLGSFKMLEVKSAEYLEWALKRQ